MKLPVLGVFACLWAPTSGYADPARPDPDASPRTRTLPQPAPLPAATPILAVDDTRTHGPTARNFVDAALDLAWLHAPDGRGVEAATLQLAMGVPRAAQRNLHDLLARYDPYQVRLRAPLFHDADGWRGGPLTLAMQRYAPIGPVAMAPLAHAHTGVELAVSTPWLSDRFASPPTAIQVLHGVDTELAQNGWSLRPLSGYLRVDFLACRTAYVELGGAPEVFVRSAGGTEYDARYHVAGGWSFGCADRVAATRPKLVLEYRGRIRVHAGDEPVAYRDSLGLGLQYDIAGFVVQLLGTADPGQLADGYWAIVARLQLGLARGDA